MVSAGPAVSGRARRGLRLVATLPESGANRKALPLKNVPEVAAAPPGLRSGVGRGRVVQRSRWRNARAIGHDDVLPPMKFQCVRYRTEHPAPDVYCPALPLFFPVLAPRHICSRSSGSVVPLRRTRHLSPASLEPVAIAALNGGPCPDAPAIAATHFPSSRRRERAAGHGHVKFGSRQGAAAFHGARTGKDMRWQTNGPMQSSLPRMISSLATQLAGVDWQLPPWFVFSTCR